jgi:hypothetical protein
MNRCVLGATRGLIVGNFIEESEPLGDLVPRGTARAALHSLFGGALRGWRTQAYFDDTNTVSQPVVDSLRYHLPSELKQRNKDRLAKRATAAIALGATLLPNQLENLLRRLPRIRHRLSMIHGDLHGANVRVHRGEAILIDFASVQRGPLVADPAALDVSLTMDEPLLAEQEWIAFVKDAYSLTALRKVPTPRDPARTDAPPWNAIRQLRQIALADQLSEMEYAMAIAIYLLRRASYAETSGEPAGRRAIAYLLAEGLIKELTAETTAPVRTQTSA